MAKRERGRSFFSMSTTIAPEDLSDFLLEKATKYAVASFVEDDPVQIPHDFENPLDIEISGLLAATLSWGARATIIAKSKELLQRMDGSPYAFVREHSPAELKQLDGFVHRTFQSEDLKGLVVALRQLLERYASVGHFMKAHVDPSDDHLGEAFDAFRTFLLENGLPARAAKHFGSPAKGSATKRLVMYSRWMARPATEGIDFGLWSISPAKLSLPLDVHSGRVARTLGLLQRRQNDWKAVRELDAGIRALNPEDPAKLDYALFGLGVYEGWK